MTAQHSALPNPSHLVVLSHLRWNWVWQRPQHLVSRFAARRAAAGARCWFVEEPVFGDVRSAELRTEHIDGVTRAWLVVPPLTGAPPHPGFAAPGFDAPGAERYGAVLAEALRAEGVASPDVLLYTPMALDVAEQLSPANLFYDVMDDLASFMGAPTGLMLRQRRTLREADVVFAGGARCTARCASTGRLRATSSRAGSRPPTSRSHAGSAAGTSGLSPATSASSTSGSTCSWSTTWLMLSRTG